MWAKLSTESLARTSAEKPKRVIAAWLVMLVAAMGLFGMFSQTTTRLAMSRWFPTTAGV